MPRQISPDSASSFVLATLTQHADRELQIAHLTDLAAGRFNKPNVAKAADVLVKRGAIVRYKEGAQVWYSVP